MTGSGFADGIEFEETFPETHVEALVAREPAPKSASVPDTTAAEMTEARYQDQLERRLREAESMVKHTIERMRLDEEQRLVEWVEARRAEEERRLATWIDERRAAIERSIEQRLAERTAEEARLAQSRQISDEERLRQWRTELEKTLKERVAQPGMTERAPLSNGNEVSASLRDRVAATTSVRDIGRLLRDVVAEVTRTTAFALSVHQANRDEVAYRYRVASDDELGALLRRDALEDGPQSAAAHMDNWVRAQRTMRVGLRNVTVHTAQGSVRADGATVGVLTLQTQDEAIADALLARVDVLIAVCAQHLAALRDNGSYRSV